MATSICLRDVSFSYPLANKPVFTHLNLEIVHPSSIVIAGPDSSGKSTLGKLIKGVLTPDGGEVRRPCQGSSELGIGYVASPAADFIVGASVEEDLVFGLEGLDLTSHEIDRRSSEVLQLIGLSGMGKRLVHTLSGGEEQRLALAGMLAMGAQILILDEAFDALDTLTRVALRSLLDALIRTKTITVIEISNTWESVLAAERVVLLSGGRVGFDGAPIDLLKSAGSLEGFRLKGEWGRFTAMLLDRGIIGESAEDALDRKAFFRCGHELDTVITKILLEKYAQIS